MSSDTCPKCGEQLYRISGLYYDRDGIRDARFCSECLSVFATYVHGYSLKYRLKGKYECEGKEKLLETLNHAISILENTD